MSLFKSIKNWLGNDNWNATDIKPPKSQMSDDIKYILKSSFEKQFIKTVETAPDKFLPQFRSCKMLGDSIRPKDQVPYEGVPVLAGAFLSRYCGMETIGHCFKCRFTGKVCEARNCPGTHPENYKVVDKTWVKINSES